MSEINLPVYDVGKCKELLEMLKVIYKAEKTETHYIVQRNDLDRLKNKRGETLLFIAVKTANVEILKLLIEAGADVNVQDESGQSPIMQALKNLNTHEELGFRMMIKILYEANANFFAADKRGKSPVQFIVNDLNVTYDSFVHDFFLDIIRRECADDSETIAKKLIDVKYPLWGAVHLRNAEVIEHMILLGCPVDSCHPKRRFTALHEAVGLIDLKIVKVLIEHDANPDVIDSQARLPIDYLYGFDNTSQLKITKILLGKSSIQPEHLLAFQYVRKVFQYGTREMVRMFLKRVGLNDPIDRNGMFPLHYLVQNRHTDVIEELRGRKINVNARNNCGLTPLHFAAKGSHCHINYFRFLLENGADPTARDEWNTTPLLTLCMNHSVTKEKYREIAEILLLYGLDFRFVEEHPMLVLNIIENCWKFHVAEPLLKHLAMLDETKKPISELIRDKINSYEKFKSYFDVCKAELAEMKNHVISKKLTLHTIITGQMDDEKVLKDCKLSPSLLSKFEKLKEELQSNNYYHTVIKKRISTIISKLEVLQEALSVMCKLLKLGNDPYHMIVTKIMSYLNTEDHQTLVELDN